HAQGNDAHRGQNPPHGRRSYSGDPVGLIASKRDRAALLAFERAGRPARAEERHPRRGELRRRGVLGALARAEAAGHREGGPVAARGAPERALAVSEPRAGDRAARRVAARSLARPAPPSPDEADEGLARTPPGGQTPSRRHPTPQAAPG